MVRNSFIRKFPKNQNYIWHRDKKDRYISVLKGVVILQFDEHSTKLHKNKTYFIPKEIWHTVHNPLRTELIIKITEI